MARYIDADALKERLYAISVVSDDLYGMGINRGLDRAETAIDMMPTADVVPKSEVDKIENAYNRAIRKVNKNAITAIQKAKQEVAREIFEEIEALRLKHTYGEIDEADLNIGLYELKKKYTEGKT